MQNAKVKISSYSLILQFEICSLHFALPNGLVRTFSLFGADNPAARFVQLGGNERRSKTPHVLVSNSPLRVNKKSLRDSPDAVVDSDLSRKITTVRVGDVKLLKISPGILVCVLYINPQKQNIAILKCLPGGFEVSGFGPTGGAPRGPKVEKQGFPL